MSEKKSDSGKAEESQDSELVQRLRDELKQQSAALAQERETRSTLERKDAFRDAGVDPSAGPGKLLFDAYDGPADPEAVTAKAEEYGLNLTAPSPSTTSDEETSTTPSYTDQERAAMQQIDQAAQGGSPDRLPEDPAQAAHEAYEREMATTGSRKEAMAKSFNARMVTALEQRKKADTR